jgi:hypothetical protein
MGGRGKSAATTCARRIGEEFMIVRFGCRKVPSVSNSNYQASEMEMEGQTGFLNCL